MNELWRRALPSCLLALVPWTSAFAQLTTFPGSVDFGSQSMGTTSTSVPVTVTNGGGGPATISSITTVDGQFAATHACTTLASGASCQVQVTFTPFASTGELEGSVPATGQISIASDAPGSPAVVPLAGTAERSLVIHYYHSILRREPDLSGKLYWARQSLRLRDLGANPNEAWYAMSSFFFAGPEYAALGRDDTGFVQDLYATFFNRAPDSQGFTFWKDQLASGLPREVALASFIFSTEFASFSQAIFGPGASRPEVDVVMDYYRGMLARLPDEPGYLAWGDQWRNVQCMAPTQSSARTMAEAIADAFAAEHSARSRSDAQYVGDLYNAFLRRGGDRAGVQFWIDQLAGGAHTRAQVRASFMDSSEFGGRLQGVVARACLSHGATGQLEAFLNDNDQRLAIERGANGLPLVGYVADGALFSVQVVQCGNDPCTAGNTVATLWSSNATAGVAPAIAVGSDGLPVVVYDNDRGANLRIVKCGNGSCTAGNVETIAGSTADGALVAIGPGDLPIVVFDYPGDLSGAPFGYALSCADGACTSSQISAIVAGSNGVYVRVGDVRFGGDGLPVVPVATGGLLQLVRCANAQCSAITEVRTLATNAAQARPAMTMGADGFPTLVYSAFEEVNGGPVVQVVKCYDAGCVSPPTRSTIVGYDNSLNQAIAVGADGRPIIVADVGHVARVVKCGDASCSAGNIVTVLGRFGSMMTAPSVTLSSSGLPILVFGDGDSFVRVLACANAACTGN